MIAALIASIVMSSALVVAVIWLMHATIQAMDRRHEAELDASHSEAHERDALAAADTADRLRRIETARADALEEEISHADQTAIDHPDSGARDRVLARWRDANAAAATVSGDAAGPLSDPGAADGASPVTRPD